MSFRLSPRESRTVAVGGAILAIALGVRVVPAWHGWVRTARADARDAQWELAQTRRAVDDAPATRAALAGVRLKLVALGPSLLRAPTPGLAAAKAAAMITDVAADAGLALGPVRVVGDSTPQGPFGKPRVSGIARGDIAGLAQFLLLLELGPTHLTVRELVVTQAEPGAPGDRPEDLRVEFVIDALAIPPSDTRQVEGGGPTPRWGRRR